MTEHFRAFWASKQDGLHRERTEESFERIAHEISCLFPHGGKLLDVGCGNAELLVYLARHYDDVIGIDCSASMLEAAKPRLDAFNSSNVRLELGDACHFPLSLPQVDVILSHGVVQYLDPAEVSLHLNECNRVLAPRGAVGLCAIPWMNLREWCHSGGLHESLAGGRIRQSLRVTRHYFQRLWRTWRGVVLPDGVGYWYGHGHICRMAESEGFECQIVNAWYYEYRFHAKLIRKGKTTSPTCSSGEKGVPPLTSTPPSA
jgi:ubiquinone/menaquinone biosynthesis C-methylase UbiE